MFSNWNKGNLHDFVNYTGPAGMGQVGGAITPPPYEVQILCIPGQKRHKVQKYAGEKYEQR